MKPSSTYLSLVVGIALVAAPLTGQSRTRVDPPAPSLRQFGNAIEALARRVSPSVVQVLVTALGSSGAAQGAGVLERQRIIGSGVIVDPTGYIVTNAHVVSGAERVREKRGNVSTEKSRGDVGNCRAAHCLT